MTSKKLQRHLKKLRELSLREAKTKGYSGDPQKFFDPFFPWFKVIAYRKGPYLVVDRYSGEEMNVGQTVTFYRKRPIYGFNYYGILVGTGRKLGPKVVFTFLKKALRAGAGKTTHRGLDGFREGRFLYRNRFIEKQGFVEGEEKIFYGDTLVYRQVYHGGPIEDTRSYKEWSKKLLSSSALREKLGNLLP
ncbi:MAG: hypothetical protein HY459_02280 [Parcubacteria group bacterium]|nr:hypothetical protein [Parcubacteria group bacterium]